MRVSTNSCAEPTFQTFAFHLVNSAIGRRSRLSRKFRTTWLCANLIAARTSAPGTNGSAVNVGFPKLPGNSCLWNLCMMTSTPLRTSLVANRRPKKWSPDLRRNRISRDSRRRSCPPVYCLDRCRARILRSFSNFPELWKSRAPLQPPLLRTTENAFLFQLQSQRTPHVRWRSDFRR